MCARVACAVRHTFGHVAAWCPSHHHRRFGTQEAERRARHFAHLGGAPATTMSIFILENFIDQQQKLSILHYIYWNTRSFMCPRNYNAHICKWGRARDKCPRRTRKSDVIAVSDCLRNHKLTSCQHSNTLCSRLKEQPEKRAKGACKSYSYIYTAAVTWRARTRN